MVLLAILAMIVAPRAMGRIASAAAGQPALTFGVGLLTFVVAVLAGALLLIACCTGLLVWLALAAGLVVGWIAVGLWFGQRLLAVLKVRTRSALVEVGVGVFLITFASRLPLCIGFLISAIVGAIGLGAVVLTRFGTQPGEARAQPLDLLGDGSKPLDQVPGGRRPSGLPRARLHLLPLLRQWAMILSRLTSRRQPRALRRSRLPVCRPLRHQPLLLSQEAPQHRPQRLLRVGPVCPNCDPHLTSNPGPVTIPLSRCLTREQSGTVIGEAGVRSLFRCNHAG